MASNTSVAACIRPARTARTYDEDENVEPDLLVISNRWLIMVEVKLDSGLGGRQLWREYVVAQLRARECGLSAQSHYIRWCDIVRMIESF